jgi:large subunit ribosomal protein L34
MRTTYSPKNRKRNRTLGFLSRMRTHGGRRVLGRRRLKGRKKLIVA